MKLTPLEISVNKSYRDIWTEDKLAEYIKTMKKPDSERIYVMFTEVPIQVLLDFAIRHHIPEKQLKEYYERYIKPLGFTNRFFEETL